MTEGLERASSNRRTALRRIGGDVLLQAVLPVVACNGTRCMLLTVIEAFGCPDYSSWH